MRNQITTLQDALETRFFAPLRRPRTRRVGVELEFPIWNRTPGAPTDFAAVHAATDNRSRTWTLVHNGTIFNGAHLNDYMGVQHGDTDSERVLLYIVDQINVAQNHRCRALDEAERFDVLFGAIAELAQGNKLNLLFQDGEVLYAHCNFRDALHVWRDTDGVALSTRPLSMGTWTPVPFTSLVAVKNGEIVRTSPPHGNEYVYNPEDYRLVYMNFARL